MVINNKLENKNFILKLLNNNDFDLLYNSGKNKKIWEQHPENDRWKREKFKIFFNNGIKNIFGLYGIYDKSKNTIIGSTRYYSYSKKKINKDRLYIFKSRILGYRHKFTN